MTAKENRTTRNKPGDILKIIKTSCNRVVAGWSLWIYLYSTGEIVKTKGKSERQKVSTSKHKWRNFFVFFFSQQLWLHYTGYLVLIPPRSSCFIDMISHPVYCRYTINECFLLRGRDGCTQAAIQTRHRRNLIQTKLKKTMAVWPSGQRVGLAIRWSPVRVPLWPLAGFVLGHPEFKSSATLVNSQLVASCQLGF